MSGQVNIELGNGNMGRKAANLDGVAALVGSGVAVTGQFALGDILGPFRSAKDAEAKGIDASYDETNKVLLHQHIVDFYTTAGDGKELYIMPVANTVTMAQMLDKTLSYAKTLLESLKGRVRLLAVSRVPDGTYNPAAVEEFDPDVWAAITKSKELRADEWSKHRPIQIFIEGRDFQGTASSAKNLRASDGPNANRTSIIMSADNDVSTAAAEYAAYANVGFFLGRKAANPVQRNSGRIKDGNLPIENPGLSNGQAIDQFDEIELGALDNAGYIYIGPQPPKAGYFFNDDHCACPIEDDYAFIYRGRPIDKAARLAEEVFVDELKDDVDVDPINGKLDVDVVKEYQRNTEKKIEINMLNQSEISGVKCFVDPDQNILGTDQTEINLSITPKGMTKIFNIKLNFENPSS